MPSQPASFQNGTYLPEICLPLHVPENISVPEGDLRYNSAYYGGDSDSTTVTNPKVHAVMVANHVNPKAAIY